MVELLVLWFFSKILLYEHLKQTSSFNFLFYKLLTIQQGVILKKNLISLFFNSPTVFGSTIAVSRI